MPQDKRSEPATRINNAGGAPKIDKVQALRGFAALMVVLFHGGVISLSYYHAVFARGFFAFGYAGVDFFFVLSGFIITYIHMRDIGEKNRVPGYLRKRFIRIYPIYWLVTLALLPVYFLHPSFGYGYERDPGVIARSLLLFPQNDYPVLGVAWTLTHEVKFYLLFAAAILLGKRKALYLAGVILGLSALLYACELSDVVPHSIGWPPRFFFNHFNLEFGAGCLCAYLAARGCIPSPRLLIGVGVLGFIASGYLDIHSDRINELHSVLTFGVSSWLILAGSVVNGPHGSRPMPKAFNFIGDASYSIYLVHVPSLILATKALIFLGAPSLVGNAGAVIVAVLCSTGFGCTVHVFLERPLLKALGRRA